MKKPILFLVMAILGIGQSFAQLEQDDYKFFNHLNAGISLGFDGIGFDVAAPLTYNFAVRAGYTFMPRVKYSTSIDIEDNVAFMKDEVDLKGKLKMGDFHLLVDYYPFKKSSFHLTAGAYIGNRTIATIKNTMPFVKEGYWGNSGIELGNTHSLAEQYTMISEAETGDAKMDMKVNVFKPFVGVGFGRAVSKRRVGVQFDLGVQFWGSPKLYTNVKYFDFTEGDYVTRFEKLERGRITSPNDDYQDLKDAARIIEKICVYPVLKIRVNGRIF